MAPVRPLRLRRPRLDGYRRMTASALLWLPWPRPDPPRAASCKPGSAAAAVASAVGRHVLGHRVHGFRASADRRHAASILFLPPPRPDACAALCGAAADLCCCSGKSRCAFPLRCCVCRDVRATCGACHAGSLSLIAADSAMSRRAALIGRAAMAWLSCTLRSGKMQSPGRRPSCALARQSVPIRRYWVPTNCHSPLQLCWLAESAHREDNGARTWPIRDSRTATRRENGPRPLAFAARTSERCLLFCPQRSPATCRVYEEGTLSEKDLLKQLGRNAGSKKVAKAEKEAVVSEEGKKVAKAEKKRW